MRSPAVDLAETMTPRAPGADGESLISGLRAATRSAHQRLEAALPLTDPGLTIDAYRVIVEAFHGFYAPLEAGLAKMATMSPGFPADGRQKLGRLRSDLRALGASGASVDALPRCPAIPALLTPGAAFGCLYVVEGATLGGRVIVRKLRDHLGLGPMTGAAFFDGYGAETGAMWTSFCTQLDASPWPRAETLAAAVETFVELERWLGARGALR
jgi:heme oxygenase